MADFNIPVDPLHFDPVAFDAMLRGNGVVMEHHRAIRCPLGVTDRFDARAHGEHSTCSNGFIYRYVGDVTVAFTSNSTSSRLDSIGVMDGSTVQVTVPRTYDGSTDEFAVQIYDRMFLKELAAVSVNTQLMETHITGVDRLQYKAVKIEHVIDANGVEYGDNDFTVENGNIVWTGDHRPPFDPKIQRGTTYAVRYRYTPFWYVDRLLHEVRVARVMNFAEGRYDLERMPHALLLKREYLFENEERVRNGQGDARDVKAPRSGSFGPR